MKTLHKSLLTACLGLTFGTAAYSQAPNRAEDSAKPALVGNAVPKDHIMKNDGKMVMMVDGTAMPMEKTLTLEDGTKVMTDGSIVTKDGKTTKMGEDDVITMEGKMSKRTHLMLKDGKVMVVKDGVPVVMEKNMTLENGNKVATDGTVTLKDGKTTKIDETDMILLDGTMAKLPTTPGGPRNTN